MRPIMGAAVFAVGTALAVVPIAAQAKAKHHTHRAKQAYASVQPTGYSNTGPRGAPLSPGGISGGPTAMGGIGPGYIGPEQSGPVANLSYSNTGPRGAPLSPGGISTGGSSMGGPGYTGP
jgi:hypothetical protein